MGRSRRAASRSRQHGPVARSGRQPPQRRRLHATLVPAGGAPIEALAEHGLDARLCHAVRALVQPLADVSWDRAEQGTARTLEQLRAMHAFGWDDLSPELGPSACGLVPQGYASGTELLPRARQPLVRRGGLRRRSHRHRPGDPRALSLAGLRGRLHRRRLRREPVLLRRPPAGAPAGLRAARRALPGGRPPLRRLGVPRQPRPDLVPRPCGLLRLSGEGVHDDLNPRALCRRGVVESGDAGRATSDDDNRD